MLRHTNRSLLTSLWLIAMTSGCGDQATITVSDPDASTVWADLDGVYPVRWEGSEAEEHIYLYKGEELVKELAIYLSEDGYPFVLHPAVGGGPDYRIKVQDENGNFGFSESFSIPR